MDPPPYDELGVGRYEKDELQKWSICEEVGISRTQHVAALVSKLLPQIREQAKAGLSKSSFFILPSDQESLSSRGEFVGLPEEHVIVQLQGRFDGSHFWSQREALEELQKELLFGITGQTPAQLLKQAQPVLADPKITRTSWFSRKQSKGPEIRADPVPDTVEPSASVVVKPEEFYIRVHNDYGLIDTLTGKAVLVKVSL